MATPTRTRYEPEDLLAMPDEGRFELVGGELVERNVSYETSFLALLINARLVAFVLAHRLGWMVQADCGLQIFSSEPAKVRFADGAFISNARPNARAPHQGHLRVAPDLVLEVVSPNDIATDVDTKVAEYLGAGVRLVWVLYPETRAVNVFRPNGNDSRISGGGALDGEDVLPGFSLPLVELFDL